MNMTMINEATSVNRSKLNNHILYQQLNGIENIKTFMQYHLFAVWDFMSLLKSLQQELTCISIPWFPAVNSKAARLINEIVLGEESDINLQGNPASHFELYIEAMKGIGAEIETFKKFQDQWASSETPIQNIKNSEIPDFVKDFLTFTFELINEGKPHKIAAAFTYGRETIIPDMFLEILDTLNLQEEKTIEPLKYYLQRHIELDGDEHGPMAFDMLQSLCDSGEKWEEVIQTSNEAINVRIKFWDALNLELK
ncbi:MAG: DUF3050 domain-containing protein [Bacteroidia bacterium]|jgi:hypothetical protein|nr:DUF3050 domain-containing protein [Bacteroidia bacterium]